MSSDQSNIKSLFSMISASVKESGEAKKLLYRTLILPKEGPNVVAQIEQLDAIKDTLPEELQDIITNQKDTFEKALISTTSIKGHMLTHITTNKTQVTVNDPRMKKNVYAKALGTNEE